MRNAQGLAHALRINRYGIYTKMYTLSQGAKIIRSGGVYVAGPAAPEK